MYKIFIVTSNKYSNVASGCSYLFNKFYPEGEVIFLGYDVKPELFGSHKFVSMGNQSEVQTDKRYWTAGPKKFFNSIIDEYVILGLDDYWLLEKTKELIINHTNADKIDYEHVVKRFPNELIGNNSVYGKIYLANQDSPYRTSMQLSLWRRTYLLKFLSEEKWTSYDFELIGGERAMNDGARIIGYEQDIFNYQEVIYHGKIREGSIERLKKYNLYDEVEKFLKI